MSSTPLLQSLSSRATALDASKIREIAEYGMTLDSVIPLWFGEGAWPTGSDIVEKAVAALQSGDHRYQSNNGTIALRDAVCRYSHAQFGCELSRAQITVTPSGMQGLMLSAQLLVTPGDRIVAIEPGWPNIIGCYQTMGADVSTLSLQVSNARWSLDIEKLLSMLTPNTKAFIVNSPNNPTGWTLSTKEQRIILEHCRQHGIWVVSDDVYSRLYRHAESAPSFLSIANPDDRLISVNSFSKSWSMTGWRLGWMVTPAECETKLGQLTEFNTCSTPGFVQQAGVHALHSGEDEIKLLRARIKAGYDITASALGSLSRVEFIEPDGAFYVFFRVDGLNDSLSSAMQILNETGVGLAPGSAFGDVGEGYFRLCYAQPEEILTEAFNRLSPFLQ